jgi:NDP-sugar pyrophosphorylase family protein
VRLALVLTAGLGTRLRPLTEIRAKPAIPVAGEPMIRRIIRWLSANAVTEVVLNLHHLPHTIGAVIGDGSDLSVRVRYSWEQPHVLGTAGGPRQALAILGAETFLLVNGDTLTDLGLVALTESHAATGALVTLALVPNREPRRYGGVLLDNERRVTGFRPRGAAAEGSYHFIGVQIVHASVFEALEQGGPAQTVGGVYDALISERPGTIRGFVSDAAFLDVGTVAMYWATSWAMSKTATDVTSGQDVRIDPTARVSRSILWDEIDIARDAFIDECIVTDRVRVLAGARFHRSVLLRGPDGSTRAVPLLI